MYGANRRILSILTYLFVLICCCSKISYSSEADVEQRLNALESRVKQLESVMQKAGIAIPPIETTPPSATPSAPAANGESQGSTSEFYHTPAQKRKIGKKTKIGKFIEFNGLLESETHMTNVKTTANRKLESSEVVLRTAQLGWKSTIDEDIIGNFTLLWEENQTDPINVDVGNIQMRSGIFDFTVGRLYPPFGTYNSHFITNPITQELGETRLSAIQVHSAPSSVFETSVTLAKGKTYKDTSAGTKTGDFCLRMDFHPNIRKKTPLQVSAQYLSNLADTKAAMLGPASTGTVLKKVVHGYGANLGLSNSSWDFSAEYIGAAKRFAPQNLDKNGDSIGDRPRAWNIELSRNLRKNHSIALKYEGSRQFMDFPRSQFGIDSSWGIDEGVTVSTEYLLGKFDPAFSTTGNRRGYSFKTQLSLIF